MLRWHVAIVWPVLNGKTIASHFKYFFQTSKLSHEVYLCINMHFVCSFDFVELTDIFGQRIDRLNGSLSGFTVTVRGDRTTLLRIRFITDSIVTKQGFKAQYSITFGKQ